MERQNEHQPDTPAGSDTGPAVPPPQPQPETASWRPADYYAAPPLERRFPRWVPISCGAAAILALVLMTALGIFFRNGGLASFVALAIGQFQSELKQMSSDDVSAESREELDRALSDVRERLTSGTLDQSAVLPLLQEIDRAGKDRTVTPEEIEALRTVVESIVKEPTSTAAPVEL